MRRPVTAALWFALAACGASTTYTRSSSRTFPSHPPSCTLETLSVVPQRPFLELGTFDIQASAFGALRSIDEVLAQVRERACREGGDAIIARKDDATYRQAVLLRWTDTGSAAGAPAAGSAAPPATPPAPPHP